MKRLLVGLAVAVCLAATMAPPATASPQLQVEKYSVPHDVALSIDQAVAPDFALDAKISPVADKAAGKKKDGDKDEANSGGSRAGVAQVPFHLRL